MLTIQGLIDSHFKSKDFVLLSRDFAKGTYPIEKLIACAVSNLPHPYPEYASWLIIHVAKSNPEKIEPFINQMIDRVLTSNNQSVLRNLICTTLFFELTSYRETAFLDRLLSFVSDESNKVALSVYSLYKLIQFIAKYPEIKIEIDGILALKQEPMKPAMKVAIRNYSEKTKNYH